MNEFLKRLEKATKFQHSSCKQNNLMVEKANSISEAL